MLASNPIKDSRRTHLRTMNRGGPPDSFFTRVEPTSGGGTAFSPGLVLTLVPILKPHRPDRFRLLKNATDIHVFAVQQGSGGEGIAAILYLRTRTLAYRPSCGEIPGSGELSLPPTAPTSRHFAHQFAFLRPDSWPPAILSGLLKSKFGPIV